VFQRLKVVEEMPTMAHTFALVKSSSSPSRAGFCAMISARVLYVSIPHCFLFRVIRFFCDES
jgi:hypothetical protein